MKRIILCADDYAQNAAVSQAIINLAKAQRISATSCLTTSPYWPTHAAYLNEIAEQIDIGLHFNLTEGTPLTDIFNSRFPSLPTLIWQSYRHKINVEKVYQELLAQIESFVQYMGHLPAFIDGHQHIQQLPVIRDAVLRALQSNLPKQTYLRVSYNKKPFAQFPKNLVINQLGAKKLAKYCRQLKLTYNQSFAGAYHFAKASQYRQLFLSFLQQIEDNGLIMCHPGLNSADQTDPIYASRFHEYNYLMSENFLMDCQMQQINILKSIQF